MSDYELKIDFVPDSPNPSRIFRSMAGLIDSFGRFDRELVGSINLTASSDLLLHDIERGSLKAILRSLLLLPDRDALRDGNFKKVLGRMLDDARTFLLKKLEDEPRIVEKAQLEDIQTEISKIVSSVPLELINVPRPIPLARLLTTIESIESSTRALLEGDSAIYKSEYAERRITKEITINSSLQEELLEATPIQHPTRMQLPVKKPDLMGDSQWDLYMGGRVVRAKILDADWLAKFHSRAIELKPGDALDAVLEITLLQSHEGEVVGYKYQILEVRGVIPQVNYTQLHFPDNET